MVLILGSILKSIVDGRSGPDQTYKVVSVLSLHRRVILLYIFFFISFANRYNCNDVAFSPYGDYWRQMRKLCINDLLSTKMVRLFQSIRQDESNRLVDSLRQSSGSSVNLTEKIFSLSSFVTCRAAFGCVSEDNATLMKMMPDSLQMAAGFEVADLFPSSRIAAALSWTRLRRMKRMRRELDVILDDIIDLHRRNRGRNSEFGGEDLVDVFLRAKEEGQLQFPIDNQNIKAVLFVSKFLLL